MNPLPPPAALPALVPVERLTQRTERFACTALRSTMTAGACVDRSTAVHEGGRNQHIAEPLRAALYPLCAKCPVGEQVRALVGVKELPKCVVCGVPVKGARGRTPKCKDHRGTK